MATVTAPVKPTAKLPLKTATPGGSRSTGAISVISDQAHCESKESPHLRQPGHPIVTVDTQSTYFRPSGQFLYPDGRRTFVSTGHLTVQTSGGTC